MDVDRAGRRLASGSADGTVRIWDLATGAEAVLMSSQEDQIADVALSPDGRRCYATSLNGSLRAWSVETGECLWLVDAHEGGGSGCAVFPDGVRVASAGNDGVVKVWDTSQQRELAHVRLGSPVRVLEVWPNGSGIVIGCRNGAVIMWDGTHSEPVAIRKGQPGVRPGIPFDGYIGDVALSPSGRAVAVVLGRDTVHVDDFNRRARHVLSSRTHCIAVTPDGRRLVTCPTDRRVLDLWDMETGAFEGSVGEATGEVLAIAVTPDGRYALTASFDGLIKQWSLAAPTADQPESLMPIVGTARPDLVEVISGSETGQVELWNANTGARRALLDGHDGPVYSVCASSDGRVAITGSADETVRVWDLASGVELNRLDHGTSVVACALTDAGDRFVSGAVDGIVRVWQLPSCSLECVYEVGVHNLMGAMLSPDGAWVIASAAGVGVGNAVAALWRHSPAPGLSEIRGREAAFAVFDNVPRCFTPDGHHLVLASDQGVVQVLRTDDWSEVSSWKAHDDAVVALAIAPDGSRIVSGSGFREALVRVWELDGTPVSEFSGHSRAPLGREGSQQMVVRGVTDLVVTPDGRHVVSCSADRTVRIWEIDSGRQLAVFTGDLSPGWCAVSEGGRVFVAGETRGALHFLTLEGIST